MQCSGINIALYAVGRGFVNHGIALCSEAWSAVIHQSPPLLLWGHQSLCCFWSLREVSAFVMILDYGSNAS